VTLLSALVLAAVWMTVPKDIRIAPLNSSSWRAVAKHPALLLTLAITILNGCGQFTLLTYLNPSLKASLGADTNTVALILAWFGLWATTGNFAASRCVEKLGPGRVVTGALIMISAALVVWGFGAGALPAVLVAAALWGVGMFSSNSVQQARLSAFAPELASASVALNTSAIYVGQGSAAALGGALISAGHMPYLPFAGAGIVLAATALSAFVLLRRRG
jgi:MFS transporter, DHA1 family, inner membrane transport protein